MSEQMTSKTKKPEMSVIAGCFCGLAQLLTNFTHSVQEGICTARHHYTAVHFDTIEEFHLDSKVVCNQLNLAHVVRIKKV